MPKTKKEADQLIERVEARRRRREEAAN